jgi:hypothetical protein
MRDEDKTRAYAHRFSAFLKFFRFLEGAAAKRISPESNTQIPFILCEICAICGSN